VDCYVFSAEPAGAMYRDLIKFCCASASKMHVTTEPQSLPRIRYG